MKNLKRVLVTGSEGQVGAKLVDAFIKRYGYENVLASDLKPASQIKNRQYIELNVLDQGQLSRACDDFKPNTIVHLAAILSGKGEENPTLAYKINETGLYNVFDLCLDRKYSVFIPSTIAAFGPTTPAEDTPDVVVTKPETVYGMTKVLMELLGSHYFNKYGLDFRTIRYPGVVSADPPGGGTTDYIIEMFYAAAQNQPYQCFLSEETALPMMHIDDLIDGTLDYMDADPAKLTDRIYNMSAFKVTPKSTELAIKKIKPDFSPTYLPDFRQRIADSWPNSINYNAATRDWKFMPKYRSVEDLAAPLLKEIEAKFAKK
jgi:threonine 3-dehydrogenase